MGPFTCCYHNQAFGRQIRPQATIDPTSRLLPLLLFAFISFTKIATTSVSVTSSWKIIPIAGQADNIISDDKNEAVFIAVDNYIYKYGVNEHLSLLLSTLPNATGSQSDVADTISRSDSINKILLIVRKSNPDLLFSCWQTRNFSLTCWLCKVNDLKVAPLLLTNNHGNQGFKTDLDEHIKAFVSPGDTSSLLMVTSRPTTLQRLDSVDFLSNYTRLPAIGRFKITKNKYLLSLEQKSVLPYKSQMNNYDLYYDYICIFGNNEHTHFIINDIQKPKNTSFSESTKHSVRLARVCNNDTELTSYTEISLACNNQNDIYAKVAYLDSSKDDSILYIVFETNPIVRKSTPRTFICSYSMKLIEHIFHKAISDCNSGHQTSYLLAKLHTESIKQPLICNKNPSDDWCLSKTNPYIDGYSSKQYHVVEDNFIELKGISSVNFFYTTTQGAESKGVHFIGTQTGLLTKFGTDEDLFYTIDLGKRKIKSYQIGGEKFSNILANETSAGRKETKYTIISRKIIATNLNELHSIDIDTCQYYNSCHACVTINDPLDCVWCGSICTRKSECSPGRQSNSTCPPLIRDFTPRSGPISGSTRLKIDGENFGTKQGSLVVKLADQDCLLDRETSNSELIVCYVKPVDRSLNATISIDVSDESGYIFSIGSATSAEPYRYVESKIYGLNTAYGVSKSNVTIYGENLDVGSNRSVLIGDFECNIIDYNQDSINCMTWQPSNHSDISNSQPLKVFIDGQQQSLVPKPNLYTTFHFKDDVKQADNSISEPIDTGSSINLIFMLIILLAFVFLLLSLCLTRFDGQFPRLKIKASPFKSKGDDLDETKVSFRNPQSQKFANLNPSVRAGESLNGLVKLNGSVLSSDYFGKPEQLDQDKPLMNNFLDDEMLSLLAQEKILIDRKRLTLGHVLGSGQFGRVYKGFLKVEDTGEHVAVAVKTLHNRCTWDDSIDSRAFLEEGLMMRDFEHDNVLALIGVTFDSSGLPMVITPFMLYGDLRSYISDEASSPTVKELIEFGTQVAKGMAYLSNLKFVHRDLAARNCMLDENLIVKVADFGLSRDIYERDYYSSDNKKAKLPVKWMAIESLEKSIYSTKTDVWSYGVLLWELMTRGVVPYPDVDNFDLFSYLKEGRRMLRPRYCPVILYNIMLSCWDENPANRPSFDELVESVSDVITQLKEAKDGGGQQRVSRDETYCDVLR